MQPTSVKTSTVLADPHDARVMDPIVSRSLLALALGVALILFGIALAPPT